MRPDPKYDYGDTVWCFVSYRHGVFQGKICDDNAWYERDTGWEYEVRPQTGTDFDNYITTVYEPYLSDTREEALAKAVKYWENEVTSDSDRLAKDKQILAFYRGMLTTNEGNNGPKTNPNPNA